ncbi:DUF3226 domain-containing protein [Mucilaginibacter psychrotolerans]|uniref:DUF4435 domain-containing protein n=1 Tax=Mucilaginibacter psychrotolerans TaxID=1524096 RepID=A0A4Y8SFD0_9SPHI|nr:DUF3226 domain-containing protein [Mucilaginibacter psychrotolerans]TFF37144.1 hypothetical protein E2R66_13765 [Mucilaginibacter psychrotolerans]
MLEKAYPQRLLVEGNDDLHIVWSICEKFKIAENFNVIDSKGYSNLVLRIEAELLRSDLITLGMIVDADTDLSSRWNSLRTKLQRQGYEVPEDIGEEGLILNQANKPRIGLWIMPNNNLNGAIEDFIKYLIAPDDDLAPEVQNVLRVLKESGKQRCKDVHIEKSYISTWLAWQKTPGIPMGQAITFKFLSTENVRELHLFVEWLSTLFA